MDLVTLDAVAFERSRHVLGAVAEAVGASVDVRQDAPDFRRYALTRAEDAVVVDLVRERVKQISATKREVEGVLIDPPEEILANKLTALVGRQEERDLVDLYCLEQHGLRIEDALDAALAKDGGCTPATLAWFLSETVIDDTVNLPGRIAPTVLRAYVTDLVKRLRRRAAPG